MIPSSSSGTSSLDPPPPTNLFQVTLASNDLYSYLRRLATEVEHQGKMCAKVMEDMSVMKTEFASLSKNSFRMLEDHSTRFAALQNGLAVTVNQAQLRAANSNLQRQVDTIAKMLEVELDKGGGEEASDLSSASATVKANVHQDVNQNSTPTSASPLNKNNTNENSSSSQPPASGVSASRVMTPSSASVSGPAYHANRTSSPPSRGGSTSTSNRISAGAVTSGGSNSIRSSSSSANKNNINSNNNNDQTNSNSVNNVSGGGGGLRSVVEKCIADWYKTRGVVDAKIRHEITSASIRTEMADWAAELRAEMKTVASELVGITYFKEVHLDLRTTALRAIEKMQTEVDVARKRQAFFEDKLKTVMKANVRRVQRGSEIADRRISRFYDMMGLTEMDMVDDDGEEDEDDSGDYEDEKRALNEFDHAFSEEEVEERVTEASSLAAPAGADTVALREGGKEVDELTRPPAKFSSSRRTTSIVAAADTSKIDENDATAKILGVPVAVPSPLRRKSSNIPVASSAGVGTTSTPNARGSVAFPQSVQSDKEDKRGQPPQRKPSKHSGSATSQRRENSKLPSSDASDAVVEEADGADTRTNAIIHSPVFVAFRQRVLNDISDRIAAARSTQSSDIDIELLALRNDIRHRVTSSRVVELIKQYTDTETPARVTTLARKVAELSDEKVSVPDLYDGLRSKADVHLLDTKASIEFVDSVSKALREQQEQLAADLALLISDRREYRDVVQQLMIQQQRLQAIVGGGGGGAKGGSISSVSPSATPTIVGTHNNTIPTLPSINSDGSRRTIQAVNTNSAPASDLTVGGVSLMADHAHAPTPNVNLGFAPRPVTELISPRLAPNASGVAAGVVMVGTTSSSALPLPMLHKPQPPPATIGLTASQAAYTQQIGAGDTAAASAEGNSIVNASPNSNSRHPAALAAARVETESKSPLRYTRRER